MERTQNCNFENLKIEEAISLIDKAKSILDELNMKVLVDEGNIHKHDATNISFNLKLNPYNIFQNFIEGKSNKLARRAGLSIAEHLEEKDYTPYIICGTSGCGKSHLINAVGTRYKEMYPEKNVLYLSAHLFMMHYTDAIVHNYYNIYMHYYQSVDMLIVDDIQDWNDRPKTLKAAYQIISHLIDCGKQVI